MEEGRELIYIGDGFAVLQLDVEELEKKIRKFLDDSDPKDKRTWDSQVTDIANIARASIFPGLSWSWATYDSTAKPFFEKRIEMMKSKFIKFKLDQCTILGNHSLHFNRVD
jgi:hypothetical protein